MTDFSKLSKAAIIIMSFAAIVLIAIAINSGFDRPLRTTETTDLTNQVWFIGNETLVGTAGQYPLLQTVTGCVNSSNGASMAASTYVVSEGSTDGGTVQLNAGNVYNNTAVNCTITNLASSTGTTAITAFNAGLTVFATFLAVIVLALMGNAVISIFSKKD